MTLHKILAEKEAELLEMYGDEKQISDKLAYGDDSDNLYSLGLLEGYISALKDLSTEDYDMLSRENKCMAEALQRLNYTPEQISDICNGAM